VSASNHSILVGELAKTLKQNGIGIGQNRLFEVLRKRGYLSKGGEMYNQSTQRAMELGLFEIKKTVIQSPDRRAKISLIPRCLLEDRCISINASQGRPNLGRRVDKEYSRRGKSHWG
jgi:anti-repressor protein